MRPSTPPLEHLQSQVKVPDQMTAANHSLILAVREDSPEFVKNVTARMIEEFGDLLPVSALPATALTLPAPQSTSSGRHRHLGACIQCGNCAFVCPHGVIRSKYYPQSQLEGAPGILPVRRTQCRRSAGVPPCRSSPTSAPAADRASRPAWPTQSGNPTARPPQPTLKSTSTRPSSATVKFSRRSRLMIAPVSIAIVRGNPVPGAPLRVPGLLDVARHLTSSSSPSSVTAPRLPTPLDALHLR